MQTLKTFPATLIALMLGGFLIFGGFLLRVDAVGLALSTLVKFSRGDVDEVVVTAALIISGLFIDMWRTKTQSKKDAERQLIESIRESEARYRLLFENNPHPMWVYDIENLQFLAVNEASIERYGYSREEFLAMTIKEIRTAEDVDALLEDLSTQTGEFQRAGTWRHRKKDGTTMEVEIASHSIPFLGRAARLVLSNDVTDKKKIEAQLLRTQRMESIGTLAGGIAHDLNNVLAPILMAVELLKMAPGNESNLSILETLRTSAQRGANIVRQVLTFARGTAGERIPIQPMHLLQAMERMLKQTLPKSVRVRLEAPKNLWMIIGDPTQIDQVLLNLCLNARDAMPDGGTLKIAASNVMLDEHYAHLNVEAKAGPYLMIEVDDTGTGMPSEIVDKMFEPFFTTKETGKGTGLGLSTVRAIVKSHGGFANVYSEIGKGTRFNVYLPAKESAETREVGTKLAELPPGSGQLILVTDDERAVRDITRITLESYNYRVITAANGAEALARYAQQGNDIQVVLLDMMMPVMDGAATISALETMNPNVRVIAASGLMDRAKHTISSGIVRATLSKPFTAETLLKTLHEVINAAF